MDDVPRRLIIDAGELDSAWCCAETPDVSRPVDASLLRRAQDGDEVAWRQIVDDHAGLVWSIIRTFGIGPAAQEDVFQSVWLRLAESMDKIRQPDRLGAWLARVARNEAIGVYRSRTRVAPHEDLGVDRAAVDAPPDEALMRADRQQTVRAALRRLNGKCQRLLTLLVASPALSYDEIGDLLEIPVGSIGPSRSRCLDQLRRTAEVRALLAEGSGS